MPRPRSAATINATRRAAVPCLALAPRTAWFTGVGPGDEPRAVAPQDGLLPPAPADGAAALRVGAQRPAVPRRNATQTLLRRVEDPADGRTLRRRVVDPVDGRTLGRRVGGPVGGRRSQVLPDEIPVRRHSRDGSPRHPGSAGSASARPRAGHGASHGHGPSNPNPRHRTPVALLHPQPAVSVSHRSKRGQDTHNQVASTEQDNRAVNRDNPAPDIHHNRNPPVRAARRNRSKAAAGPRTSGGTASHNLQKQFYCLTRSNAGRSRRH